jgi:hypothetical protein
MALYFLVHDTGPFEGELRPALAESWRRRSLVPCAELCRRLRPRADEFNARFRIAEGEPLLARAASLPFDRDVWRALVGEVLFYAAADIPELETCETSLYALLGGGEGSPIRQAHEGSRDLVLGGAFYRPGRCGLNDAADVRRLAAYLAAVDPSRWTAADLPGVDPDEELEHVRYWFPVLAAVFDRASKAGQLIVHEFL